MDFIEEFLQSTKAEGKINSSTLVIYRKDIEDFDGFIVGKDLIDVETDDILMYIEELKKRYSDMSVYRKISSLKSFYKYLLKSKIIDDTPIKGIELSNRVKKSTKALEKWELKKILDICGDSYEERRDSLVIRLLYETGLKIGDILTLEREVLEKYDYKILNIHSSTKIISERLSENLVRDLKKFVDENILKKFDNKIFGELTRESFRVRFISYGKKAELEREISPNMIKKIIIEEKTRDENGLSFLDKIKEQYMKIGIGDD